MFQEYKMDLDNYLQTLAEKAKRAKANSERAYWVDLTAQKLSKPFKQVLGLTRDWKVEWIKDLYLECEKSDNFSRLWFGLIKKSRKMDS